MTDVSARVEDIRRRIDAATRDRASAEIHRRAAEAQLAEHTATLRTEFGVTTTAEARDLLDRLHADLETALADLDTALDATTQA